MCIFVASTEHEEFPFILLDNRDEYFDRPTAPAHWWDTNPNIYAPQDLQRDERGTWIGVTRSGRVAVLVNYFEDNPKISKISRGALPKQFLESELPPKEWAISMKEKHKNELENSGGFTLLVAQISVPPTEQTSQQHRPSVEVEFLTNEKTLLPRSTSLLTLSLSNGSISDSSWTKTARASELLKPLFNIKDPRQLLDGAIQLLSTKSEHLPTDRHDLRNHIFVPIIPGEVPYGTRTQTVVFCDNTGHIVYNELDVVSGEMKSELFKVQAT